MGVSHPHSHNQLTSKMDIASKNDFIYWMQRAVEDQQNDCYIELYNILLRAFVSADCDFDGQVSQDEFGGMISAAAALPKKFGFDWWQGSPADMFKAIDDNGDGSVPARGGEGEDLCQDGRERGWIHRLQRVARLLPSGNHCSSGSALSTPDLEWSTTKNLKTSNFWGRTN